MEKQNWKFKLGLMFLILSMIIFLFIFFVPLLNTSDKNKIFIAGVAAVAAEVLFWTGGLLLGRQIFNKYKSYLKLKYWFDKKKEENAGKQDGQSP